VKAVVEAEVVEVLVAVVVAVVEAVEAEVAVVEAVVEARQHQHPLARRQHLTLLTITTT